VPGGGNGKPASQKLAQLEDGVGVLHAVCREGSAAAISVQVNTFSCQPG
jgi:hypothetical protein